MRPEDLADIQLIKVIQLKCGELAVGGGVCQKITTLQAECAALTAKVEQAKIAIEGYINSHPGDCGLCFEAFQAVLAKLKEKP